MGFSNYLVTKTGFLVRTFIRSVNYVAGSAGWTINKDGSAEFNNVTVRGIVEAGQFIGTGEGQEILIYTGTPAAGNLQMSATSAPFTDPHGNAGLRGFTYYFEASASKWFATQIAGEGAISVSSATSAAGPWSQVAALNYDSTNSAIDLSGPNVVIQSSTGTITLIPLTSISLNGPVTATDGTTASPTKITTDTGTLVSSFGTGWAASGSAVNGVWFLLLPDGMVYCAIDVKTTSTTPGGNICTIPAAYLPKTNITGAHVNNPGTPANGAYSVTANATGGLTISVPGSVSGTRYAGSFIYPGAAYTV